MKKKILAFIVELLAGLAFMALPIIGIFFEFNLSSAALIAFGLYMAAFSTRTFLAFKRLKAIEESFLLSRINGLPKPLRAIAESEFDRLRSRIKGMENGSFSQEVALSQEQLGAVFDPFVSNLDKGLFQTVTILDFWTRKNMGGYPKYLKKNVEAAIRGGTIERIFILERGIRQLPSWAQDELARHLRAEKTVRNKANGGALRTWVISLDTIAGYEGLRPYFEEATNFAIWKSEYILHMEHKRRTDGSGGKYFKKVGVTKDGLESWENRFESLKEVSTRLEVALAERKDLREVSRANCSFPLPCTVDGLPGRVLDIGANGLGVIVDQTGSEPSKKDYPGVIAVKIGSGPIGEYQVVNAIPHAQGKVRLCCKTVV